MLLSLYVYINNGDETNNKKSLNNIRNGIPFLNVYMYVYIDMKFSVLH